MSPQRIFLITNFVFNWHVQTTFCVDDWRYKVMFNIKKKKSLCGGNTLHHSPLAYTIGCDQVFTGLETTVAVCMYFSVCVTDVYIFIIIMTILLPLLSLIPSSVVFLNNKISSNTYTRAIFFINLIRNVDGINSLGAAQRHNRIIYVTAREFANFYRFPTKQRNFSKK